MYRSGPATASTSLFATLLALVGFGLFVDGALPGLVAVAVTAVLALACCTAAACAPSAERAHVRGAVLRRQADRLAFLPSRDPDGPGRSRPRAPGVGPAARC